MKGSSFAIGMAAGAVVGAAISMTAENYMTPRMRRDMKKYTHKGMKAMGHIAEGIGTLMHE
ncbi:hypothetical protein [Intestinimonas butyriciproducens]|uniref:hypothetical protein n=1 Tax=Intestinimonas butyriciproducens TaxID=1297617 RepID=UPI0019564581|nr:hypothetical protein [Intestinimonas butyriciproducens]MBM6918055.1 hypothetical protein [Intestinimonas butyriciproducens]